MLNCDWRLFGSAARLRTASKQAFCVDDPDAKTLLCWVRRAPKDLHKSATIRVGTTHGLNVRESYERIDCGAAACGSCLPCSCSSIREALECVDSGGSCSSVKRAPNSSTAVRFCVVRAIANRLWCSCPSVRERIARVCGH